MLTLTAAALTESGRQRDANEDRVFALVQTNTDGEPLGLFIVCDGIGGNLAGEHASHWAVETIKRELADYFTPPDPMDTIALPIREMEAIISGKTMPTRRLPIAEMEERVHQAILRANQVVYNYAQHKPQQAGNAGTKVSMALVQGDQVLIANVGDSRTYLLRDGDLRQITRDHSLVGALVAGKQIKSEDIYSHPQRNIILRSLGEKKKVTVDTFAERLQAGDHLLLCTDGLWEMLRDPLFISQTIQKNCVPRQACEELVKAANQAGGEDNIGVVVVNVV